MPKQDSKMLYRAGTFTRKAIDEENRTAELSFSSEEPVERWDGFEILGHADGEMDTSFIGSGSAPLLLGHDHTQQIGVVSDVRVEDGRGRASVRFGKSGLASEIFQDVVDGIRGNVSVGYRISEYEETKATKAQPRTYRATNWSPMEISIVPVPADTTVGVGRSDKSIKPEHEEITMTDEVNTQPAPQVDVTEIRASADKDATKAANKRAAELVHLGNTHNMQDAAMQFLADGRSADEFRAHILENLGYQNPVVANEPAEIGLSEKEVKRYSFMKAIRAVCYPSESKFQKEAAFEIEASIAAGEQSRQRPTGIMVPLDVLQASTRDLNTGVAGEGGNIVGTDHLGSSFIEILRNAMVVRQLGARVLSGLQGNVQIPSQTGAGTAYWVAEGAAPTESQQVMGQLAMTPKTVGAYTDYTRQLLLQSDPSVEMLVREDLALVLAIEMDRAALYGAGTDEPVGIANTANINTTTFGAALPTWAEMVAMETAVAVDNALLGNLAYVTDPTVRGALKTTAKDAGSGIMAWEGNEVNGYTAAATNQVVAEDVFFGNWRDIIIGLWGGLDLTVDTAALATSGGRRVIALQSSDIGVRHAASFCLSNDGI